MIWNVQFFFLEVFFPSSFARILWNKVIYFIIFLMLLIREHLGSRDLTVVRCRQFQIDLPFLNVTSEREACAQFLCTHSLWVFVQDRTTNFCAASMRPCMCAFLYCFFTHQLLFWQTYYSNFSHFPKPAWMEFNSFCLCVKLFKGAVDFRY